MTPRDRLELDVLTATGDPELAAKAGRLAATVVEVHAQMLAEATAMPADYYLPGLWKAATA